MCLDLACENGLSCMGGVCVADGGSSGGGPGTTSTNPPATSSTGEPPLDTEGTDGPVDTDGSSGVDATTGGSTGDADVCGDFIVGLSEECDGGQGCSDTCELEVHDCNPLNNVPCPQGFKCSWQQAAAGGATYTCIEVGDAVLGLGEGNCFEGGVSADQNCEVGLACYNGNFLSACDEEGCCVEYCDVNSDSDGDQCSVATDVCVLEPDIAPGLSGLGVCRAPV